MCEGLFDIACCVCRGVCVCVCSVVCEGLIVIVVCMCRGVCEGLIDIACRVAAFSL